MLRGQYSEAEDGKLPPLPLEHWGLSKSSCQETFGVFKTLRWDSPFGSWAPQAHSPRGCGGSRAVMPLLCSWHHLAMHTHVASSPSDTTPKHRELKTCIKNQWKYFIWKPDKLDIWWGEARIPEKEVVCKKVKLHLQKLCIAYSPRCLCLNSSTSTSSIHTPTHSTLHVLPFPSHPQINWLWKQSLCR